MLGFLKGIYYTAKALILNNTVKIKGTEHKFSRYPEMGHHVLEILPDTKANQPYQNLRDGIRGDKRGWYAAKKGTGKWHKFWWNAIRNPMNTQKRLFNSIDIAKCKTWVKDGYLPHVDDDHESLWGEKWIYAQDLETGDVYESYESMKPLYIFGWFTGRCVRRMEGYKFDFGEELIPFPESKRKMDYEYYKELCFQYARDGYHQGEAMITLDRLAPLTGRKRWMFTLKKIDNS